MRVPVRARRLVIAGVLLGVVAAGVALIGPRVRAWHHFRAARTASERGHNPQAVRHLQACLRVWPEDPKVLLLAARAARRARAYAEAELSLQKYQRARGLDDAGAFEQLLLSAEWGSDEKVINLCWRRVEEGDPQTPLILEALTRAYFRQYRLREARACLDRWLEARPDDAQALCLKGQLHFVYEHARYAAAESYRRAVQVDPEHEEARLGLALAALESKNYPEAAEHLGYLHQSQPDNLRVQVGLAQCRDAAGDRAEAIRMVDRVLAVQPDHAPALALCGRLALESGQHADAEVRLRQAVELDPGDHQARHNLMLCLYHNGKDAEAKEHDTRLKQRDADLKRFDEIVNVEMRERPRDPALHCELGQLLLRSGQRKEGIDWLKSALRQNYAPAKKALEEVVQPATTESPPPEGGTRPGQ